jgi:hypothetical protein
MDTKDRELLSFFKEMVEKAIEGMMKEERAEYLEKHPEMKGKSQMMKHYGIFG